MHRYAPLLFALLLTACATGPYPVTSPYYQIPAGSHLVLKQGLTIPPEEGRVFIQDGKVKPAKQVDQYYPHCWFLSWTISKQATHITPDDFVVIKTEKNEDYVQREQPLMLASRFLSINGGMASGATAVEYSTTLNIHSEKNPEIRRFTCNHWEDPTDAYHLTVAQIRQTLGDIAEIQLGSTP